MTTALLSPPVPDLSTFKGRTSEFFRQTVRVATTWFDPAGNWLAASRPLSTRDRYWLCLALYARGERALADTLIRISKTHGVAHDGTADSSFNIFHTNIACALLMRHRKAMAGDVVAKLEHIVGEGLAFLPGNRQIDYQFHGYNDNMPAKATMGLILGGEMLGDADAVEHGLWNLRTLRNQLFRRGINSEYNSPTYTPLTLYAMGKIAHYARSSEARELALKIEHRLWLDLAARFHPEIGVLSGPYSRAYNCDTLAHVSSLSVLLWFVLGDIAKPSILEIFDPAHAFVLHHKGDTPHNIVNRCWSASGNYHLPARLRRLFHEKQYPFRAVAMAEAGDGGPDAPAGPTRIESFLHKDYTVGTSTTQFLGGEQSIPYLCTFKRREPVASYREIGMVFHKFTINDEVPGMVQADRDAQGRRYPHSGEADNLNSRCHLLALQAESTVMLHTQPALSLGGMTLSDLPSVPPNLAANARPRLIRRLNEMLIIPAHSGAVEEVRIGPRPASSWAGKAACGQWIGVRSGKLLLAIRPMAYTDRLGVPEITLEKIHRYEVVRTTFYHGPERTFTRGELKMIFGGYLIEHASTEEYPSLALWMEALEQAAFSDIHLTTRRMRYRRPAFPGRPALEMELSTSVSSRSVRHALINGRCIPQDVRLQIDGFRERDIPIIRQPWESIPSFFPWTDLRVPWWDLKGTIGDREALREPVHQSCSPGG